jgi:hypothetical protein
MPITFASDNITAINNGEPITATILNGPSVDLKTRTDEVKRNSEYDNFLAAHTEGCLVKLVPTAEEVGASVELQTEVLSDEEPAPQYNRYYRVSLSGAALSVYSKAVPGGRYIVQGSHLASFFGDSVDSTNYVLSHNLVTPGDGVYLKVPLRSTGSDDNETLFYPDKALPYTEGESLSTGYLLDPNPASLSANTHLVKLPMLTEITLVGGTTAGIVASLKTELTPELGTTGDIVVDGTTNALAIDDNAGNTLTLRLNGVQGSRCTVTHIRDNADASAAILTVARGTSPIYRHLGLASTQLAVTGLSFGLYNDTTQQGSDATDWIAEDSVSTYKVEPVALDPGFAYIPLVRLTESSLEVGDRAFSLVNNYAIGANTVPLIDLHAPPIGALSLVSDVGIKTHKVDIIDPEPPLSSGLYTVRLPKPAVVGGKLTSTLNNTNSLLLLKLLAKIADGNMSLVLGGVRYKPISNIATTGFFQTIVLSVKVGYTGTKYLSVSASTQVSAPLGSLYTYPSSLEAYAEDANYECTASASATQLVVTVELWADTTSTKAMTGGDFYAEVDLILTSGT